VLLRAISIPNPFPILAAVGDGMLSSLSAAVLFIVAACSSTLNDLSLLISRAISNPLPILVAFVSRISASLRQATLPSSKLKLRNTLRLIILSLIASSLYDAVKTRKRQSIDATSEWGRYAQYPLSRGRALCALMLRIAPSTILASTINCLPGGGNSLFRSKQDKQSATMEQTNNRWAQKASNLRQQSGNMFAEGLFRLGPSYINIGQVLCRKDFVPDEWKSSLEILQNRVLAKSGSNASELAYQAYDGAETNNSTFADFGSVPLTTASLNKVRQTRLKSNNNATIAIELLQRPQPQDMNDKDFLLMIKIAKVVDSFAGKLGQVGEVQQMWLEIFQDAEKIWNSEIDHKDEADNTIRLSKDFGIDLVEETESFIALAIVEEKEASPILTKSDEQGTTTILTPVEDEATSAPSNYKVSWKYMLDQAKLKVISKEDQRRKNIINARKQPKSEEEEKALAEYYGSMEIRERAFAILYDLGMIEISPDPDSPDYDHTLDNEFAL